MRACVSSIMYTCGWLDLRSENFKKSSTAVKVTGWAPVQVHWCVLSDWDILTVLIRST